MRSFEHHLLLLHKPVLHVVYRQLQHFLHSRQSSQSSYQKLNNFVLCKSIHRRHPRHFRARNTDGSREAAVMFVCEHCGLLLHRLSSHVLLVLPWRLRSSGDLDGFVDKFSDSVDLFYYYVVFVGLEV